MPLQPAKSFPPKEDHTMKKNNAYRIFKNFLFSGTLLASSALFSLPLFAQTPPTMGDIDMGLSSGNISYNNVDLVTITSGDRAYINWGKFGIDTDQTGTFTFNNPGGVVLNHVTGGSASAINGNLNSNGFVYVINPNGLTIGNGVTINTQGFAGIGMKLDLQSKDDFLSGQIDKNSLKFTGNGAAVTNNGSIEANDIILMGSSVTNTGTIKALDGDVDLIAVGNGIVSGDITVTHNAPGNNLITIGGIKNIEDLVASGGNIYAMAINNSGTIRANKISNEGGRITLIADGNIKIDSSVIATIDGDINIGATRDISFETTTGNTTGNMIQNTMVNAYGEGNVNVTGRSITLNADKADTYISVGSNHGETNVTTTAGDLNLLSTNGGYAQVGYHFRDDDTRIFSMTANNDSLFSGYDITDRDGDMVRLAGLYVPTGDINVTVANDLILDAKYDKTNPASQKFLPAAQIGHAYLASSKDTGESITKYKTVGAFDYPAKHTLSGNTTVNVKRDVVINSDGAAIARVGHNVRNFVGIASNNSDLQAQEVHGDVTLMSGQDIRIDAKNGGTSGIGHLGDEFDQPAIAGIPDDTYSITADRHTKLSADGTRTLNTGDTWHSIAQIGSNMMGDAAAFKPDGKTIFTGGIQANIVSLSGANVILTGDSGGISVIGHENNSVQKYSNNAGFSATQNYRSSIIVGYSLNRYKELDTTALADSMTPAMLEHYKDLRDKGYFNSSEKDAIDGSLLVDGNSRIGKEFGPSNYNLHRNVVGIVGFRMKRNGVDSAITLEDGAQIGGGKIDSLLVAPGYYKQIDPGRNYLGFYYNLGEYPGDGVHVTYPNDGSHYPPVEYYSYADYAILASENQLDLDDLGLFEFDKLIPWTQHSLYMFYPSVKPSDDIPPPHIDPPRWEEPRYPWIPAWFEPCCCPCDPCDPCYDPCAVVVCCDPCELTTTCDSYVPKVDLDDENSEEQTPTLAPVQDENNAEQIPTLAPPKPE